MTATNSGSAKSWVDPDDAPELTAEWFERAEWCEGERVIRRGRPKAANAKKLTVLRKAVGL